MKNRNIQKTSSLLISYTGCPRNLTNLYPDNGLASLAACLIKNGHKTKILDYGTVDTMRLMSPGIIRKWLKKIYTKRGKIWGETQLFFIEKVLVIFRKRFENKTAKDILNIIKSERIDFIGFKLFVGDGFRGSISIAKKIKRRYPNLKIFAGGPTVDICCEHIYREFDGFDALAYGEGEETIVMLAEFVQGRVELEKIPNLIIRRDGKIITTSAKKVKNLNNLPFPVYDEDVYLSMRGNKKVKVIVFDESRGCPYRCAFCNHREKSGTFTRTKTAKRIVEEMEFIIKKYGISSFRFAGSNPPPKLMESIAEEVMARGLKVYYHFLARVNFSKEEMFHKMKESGALSVLFGIESGSQYLLDKINKNCKVSQIKTAVKAAKKAGLFVIGSFIFPLPFENDSTKKETINLVKELKLNGFFINPPGVFPGTEWVKNSDKYNIEILATPAEFAKCWMYFDIDSAHGFLPVKFNGKNSKEVVIEERNFIRTLIKQGLFRTTGEDGTLLSHKIGILPEEFSHLLNPSFFSRDYVAISQILKRLNKPL